jgi:mannose-6-phosphate isomerase-like protein (cupin superfamily)
MERPSRPSDGWSASNRISQEMVFAAPAIWFNRSDDLHHFDRRCAMNSDQANPLHLAIAAEAERLARLPVPFAVLFERGDVSIELFAPRGVDTQLPHSRDEIYIVASGSGIFRRGEERVRFSPGDFLFVAAGVPHVFEQFSADFRTWVIFFGPEGGTKPSGA